MADVLIAGAGPTGLLLAGDLASAGVSCTILERRTDESNLTRAFAVHARTLETLDARGLADELVSTGEPVASLRLLGRVRIDLSELPSRYPFLLVTPQYQTERLLARRAEQAGVDVLRGAQVTGVGQDGDGVAVETRTADGRVETHQARYLVGTDGVHSAVRDAIGQPFPGRSAVRSVMLANVRLGEEPPAVLNVNAVGDAFALVAPFGDGWYRVIAWDRRDQQPDRAPVTLDEIRVSVTRALGTDYGLHDPRWMSRFHSDERQVPAYRMGRSFLAGDAAHVHSPAGGQGMNTGLQDAANLSWKLASVLTGQSGPELLDTYQRERHPVGRTVLRLSGGLLRIGLMRPWQLPAVRLFAGTATRSRRVRQRMAGLISGIGIGYPRPRGAHPLAGQRAPDIALPGQRLYEALRGGQFVLVTPGQTGSFDGVRTVRGPAGPTMLVRPDGYVAWAAEHPGPAQVAAAVATRFAPGSFA